jgi:hypothetical protein
MYSPAGHASHWNTFKVLTLELRPADSTVAQAFNSSISIW